LAHRLQRDPATLDARLSDAAGIRGSFSNYPTLTVISSADNALRSTPKCKVSALMTETRGNGPRWISRAAIR
jgi:hypothetical protein